jgi:hypothetical protein
LQSPKRRYPIGRSKEIYCTREKRGTRELRATQFAGKKQFDRVARSNREKTGWTLLRTAVNRIVQRITDGH